MGEEMTSIDDWRKVHEKYEANIPNEDIQEAIEPPCKNCYWFKPMRTFNRFGMYDGLHMCHSQQDGNIYMSPMFICFVGRKDMEKAMAESDELEEVEVEVAE